MNRLHYLDHLRSFAMVFGIFLHTTTLANFGWIEVIGVISNNFRMGTFFAISGFFAGFLLNRRSLKAFWKSRILALGVPLIFGLIVLNPLTLWLVYNWHIETAGISDVIRLFKISMHSQNDIEGHFVWHLHLWFLISLIFYTITAPFALKIINCLTVSTFFRRSLDTIPKILLPTIVAIILATAVVGARAFFLFFLEPLGAPWLVRATLSYAPYYALGLILFRLPRLWHFLHRVDMPLILLTCLLWALPQLDGVVETIISIIRRELTVCASFFFLLAFFQYFFSKPTWLGSLLSEGIYTAYLLHYFLIYFLALSLSPVLLDGTGKQFFIISGLVLLLTFGLHYCILKFRIRTLRFLFNGRWS